MDFNKIFEGLKNNVDTNFFWSALWVIIGVGAFFALLPVIVIYKLFTNWK